MRRIVVLVLALVWLVSVGPTASASPRILRHYLTATVSGSSVTASAGIEADEPVLATAYGICVRDRDQRIVDFGPMAEQVTLSSTMTVQTRTKTFASGTYRYYPCVLVAGRWSRIGESKYFTVGSGETSPEPTVLFSDTFDGAAGALPDPTKWGDYSACGYDPSAAYGLIRCGADEKLDGDGHLLLPATPTWGSAISTGQHFAFVTGTVTFRAKLPAESGYWPSLWALNSDPDPEADHNARPIGEVDAMEAYTALDPKLFHHGVHNYTAAEGDWGGPDEVCGNGTDLSSAFHDYSMTIRPGEVSFSFDGKLCGSVRKADGHGKQWTFPPDLDRPTWLILANAVGGADGRNVPALHPSTMLVDSVKVTALS